MKIFKNLKEARKGLKLPGGQNADVTSAADVTKWGGEENYSWSKRGGYADTVMEKLRGSLRKARWTMSDHKGFAVPDGSFVGGTNYWTKGGWVVAASETYGGVKWDNSFSVTLRLIKG